MLVLAAAAAAAAAVAVPAVAVPAVAAASVAVLLFPHGHAVVAAPVLVQSLGMAARVAAPVLVQSLGMAARVAAPVLVQSLGMAARVAAICGGFLDAVVASGRSRGVGHYHSKHCIQVGVDTLADRVQNVVHVCHS